MPAAELAAETARLAEQLARGATQAYAAIKSAVAYSATHSLLEALHFEGSLMASTGATTDHRNAVKSFLAKEKPTFEGS